MEQIQQHTLVDKLRCYELWQLVEQSSKLEKGCLIEIGVWRGGTGALIAKKAKSCGINNKIYLCDTFTGVVKASQKDPSYFNGEHADTSKKLVEDLVFNKLDLKNVQLLQGIFPDDTGKEVENESFRFCHIDVDVYQSAKDIVEWIWPKMISGGIIVFDDYGFESCKGIATYVHELQKYKGNIVLHNLNGHAVVIKI